MTERLHDATVELRVRFTESGHTQEFLARIHAEKFLPVVVNLRRDSTPNSDKISGGQITIETRAPIEVKTRLVDPLPYDIETTIDQWLVSKRHELRELAAKKVKAGAENVRINERGEMRKT